LGNWRGIGAWLGRGHWRQQKVIRAILLCIILSGCEFMCPDAGGTYYCMGFSIPAPWYE
jgi:hypothetical protein